MISYRQARANAPKAPDREARLYQRELVPLIEEIYLLGAKDARKRFDAKTPLWKLRLDAIKKKIAAKLEPIFWSIASRSDRTWSKVLGQSLNQIGLTTSQEKLLDAWVKENTDLIVNLVPEMYQRAEATVKEATKMGLSQRDLTKRIREDLRVPKARANLIARDQTLKVNSQLSEAAHKEAGISKFMWVTSADERVREDHQMLNGEIFDYDNPPAIGLPGTDFQCRCIAYPVIEGVNF